MSTTRTVSVMFTDLVGSTATSSQLDAVDADQLRDVHFTLLRTAINQHGGREVKNLGDGVMAAFDSTTAALAAAEAIQQAAEAHNRGSSNVPLAIRIGISLGEVVEDDSDYFGDPVVEASRLCAVAAGGQILTTRLVELTAGRRTTQQLQPVGRRELKGLPEPVDVVEVVWAPAAVVSAEIAVPLPARCQLAPDSGVIGRAREFDELTAAFKHAAEGSRRVAMLGGEPGIGKTTTSCAFARQAYAQGAIVLFGRADEDLGLPYQPWVEVLRHLIDHAPAALGPVLARHQTSLSRILPQLDSVAPVARDEDAEAARYVLYEAVREVLASAASLAPLVVLLDDIQWADGPSLALLRHLISGDEPLSLMVVATFRESEVSSGHPLADLLAWLHRQNGITRLSLRGLDDSELLALMETAAGQDMDADGLSLRDALLAETDGNPFFVTELLRHLVETQAIYQQDDRWVASVDLRTSGLPVSVQEVIGRRVNRLGSEPAEILAVAAVIGPEFDLATLTAVTSAEEDAVLGVIETACEARLLTELGPEQYRFAHALVEHSLYDSLSPTRRARLHRRIAELIEADEAQRHERVGELANHWAKATAPADAAKAVEYAVLAGERALNRLAPDEGLRWFTQAEESLAACGSAPDERLTTRVLIGLGEAQRQLGLPAYRATLLEAANRAEQIGATELLVRAALLNNRGFMSSVATAVDRERVDVIEAALRAVGETEAPERARLLALLAAENSLAADLDEQDARVATAVDIARRSGDPRTLASVITTGYLAIDVPETLVDRMTLIDEALSAARECGDLVLQFWATNFKAYTLYQTGEIEAAHALHDDVPERIGQPMLRWIRGHSEATYLTMIGDLAGAYAAAAAAHRIGEETGQPDIALYYLAQFGQLKMLQGDGEGLVEVMVESARESPHVQSITACLARILCTLGRHDEALAALRQLIDGREVRFRNDLLRLGSEILCAEVVAELGLQDSASALYPRLLPFADRFDYDGVQSWGSVSEALARLAAVQGLAVADEHFTEAIATYERVGAAYFLARTQIYYGQWLMRRTGGADAKKGSHLVEQGLLTAQERGYPLLERIALG